MRVAGVDIGTTTISIVVLDALSGEMTGRKTIEHGSGSFMEGEFATSRIQDPERICRLAREGLEELTKDCSDLAGIGMTGQMHGMLYVDSEGNAVSPLYTWQDGSGDLPMENGQSAAQFLRENVGNAATGYGVTTHCFLQKTGRIPEKAAKMTTISDYLAMKLCGTKTPVLGADMAASWGCFDLEKNEFLTDRLEAAGVDTSYLPEVSALHRVVGKTDAGVPVICSLGDNQASVIGSVRDLEDTVLLNVGTGSQISFGTADYIEIGGNVELRPCGEGGFIMAGSSLCGGRAYAMLEQFYRSAPGCSGEGSLYAAMLEQAEAFLKENPAEAAWDIYPAFSGTRSNPSACGSMGGIRTTNFTPGAMTVGMIRGILGELAQHYTQMCRLTGKEAHALVGSGNAIRRNPLMKRLAEEMFGMPMQIPAYQEEAACGAALQTLASTGVTESLAEAQTRIRYL